MASTQIPNLPAATALTGAEQLEAVQAGTSVQVTINQITDVVSADVASYAAAAAASASSAATSAASALDSENQALIYSNDASDSAAAAAASAASIVGDAAAAAASAAAALASEVAAAASETAAAGSATDALASEVAAAASEVDAAASASDALASAGAASGSESAALASENAAFASQLSATASASAASSSASSASGSAGNASNSATAASASAANAAASAASIAGDTVAAAASASAASGSEVAAASSASAASGSASAAAGSASAAATSLDNFEDQYLGAKSSDPTVDNDGNPLIVGALYFNTVSNVIKVWSGSAWQAAYVSLGGALLSANNLSDVDSVSASRTNLGLGTAATTNATAYATAAQGTLADGALQRSGGTMTGALVLAADPTVNLQAATKQYVDTVAAQGIHYHEPVYVESPNTAGNLTATYANGGTNSNIIDIANGSDITFFGYTPAVGDQFLTSTGNGLTSGTPYWIVALTGSAAQISLTFGGPIITTLTNGTPTLPSLINPGVGATLTNAGAQVALTIDGVLMTVGKRVLIYNQTNGYENGVYTVTTVGTGSTNWVLTRAIDADTYDPSSSNALGQGDAFFVQAGATGAGETYALITAGSIFFGTTNIAFSQISASQVYSAGAGLNLTGTVFSIDNTVATLTGIQTLTNKTLTSPTINGGTITGITDLAVADGGTGASDAATARTNLGAQATITGAATTITASDLTASRALASDASGKVAVSAVTSTELGYVSGVTSAIQTQLGTKQATITGGASTITTSDLTALKALVSDASGKVAVSTVTNTELGYVSGVTSAIQTQLGTKAPTASPVLTGQVSLDDGSATAPSLTNTGDLNTGLFFPAEDTVGLGTGGAERMRIDASGNVGIGVTPSAWSSSTALQIGATSAFWNILGNGTQVSNNYAFTSGGNLYIANGYATTYVQNSSGQHVWYNAPSGTAGNAITFTQAMTLDASGNLGLGYTSPRSVANYRTLALGGTSNGSLLDMVNGSGAVLGTWYSDSTGSLTINADPNGAFGSSVIAFQVDGTERARIDSSGNLGIGVTPSAWNGAYKAVQLPTGSIVSPNNGSLGIGANIYTDGATTNRYVANGFSTYHDQTNGQYRWFNAPSGTAGNAITFTQAMTLDANGDLAIGSTDTDSRFKVEQAGVAGLRVAFNNGSTNFYDADLNIFRSGNGTERARIDASGNVGIGTSSPASKLDVNGTIRDQIGDVRDLVNSTKTATYALAATDNGKLINITTGGVTIRSVFTAGQNVTIYNNSGSSQPITQGGTVTMYLAGTATTGSRTLAQRGICTVLCVDTNTFVCSGAGVT